MKTCVSGRTEIMWNTHRVGVTADNIVRYKASSLTILRHSLPVVYKYMTTKSKLSSEQDKQHSMYIYTNYYQRNK